MNRRVLKSVVLSEIVDSDSTVLQAAAVTELINYSTLTLHKAAFDLFCNSVEEDVYVADFFEKIIPEYSEITFKTHFRMSRDTMQVSYK